jgi:hypothetical protein
MNMNTNLWIFRDGVSPGIECNSFPFAFRAMFYSVKDGLKKGRKLVDMEKSMSIISPIKDIHGDRKKYSYTDATKLAKSSGLLTADGTVNSKEFKHY